jgi:hypothetical protein
MIIEVNVYYVLDNNSNDKIDYSIKNNPVKRVTQI